MGVAINLLTDDPAHPTGAHWGWSRTIPEMAKLLTPDEEFLLVVSPKSRPLHEGYGGNTGYITFPWSNEHMVRRTLSEHLYSPLRLPLSDRKSTRLNSSHMSISYAVFCLKKKKNKHNRSNTVTKKYHTPACP